MNRRLHDHSLLPTADADLRCGLAPMWRVATFGVLITAVIVLTLTGHDLLVALGVVATTAMLAAEVTARLMGIAAPSSALLNLGSIAGSITPQPAPQT